ncbi:bifunctional glutamate N-acetyltransferase/amino-acid acetyltransferase ArgJ [Tissierella creatinini]|nr:bifunctional glutamate N-acetyltransferase/amino-acid acetyltransferase ArgJ [Tissierella creatinini]TJX63781.1 bifunctional glutamate N-acetyltransferase/amino-acid acetyltransferase ArgJ [Soehngenia saccharolytica]
MIKIGIKTITDVPGFVASGIWAGLKKSGKKDLGIIFSKERAVASGTFTQNKAAAPLIKLNKENIDNENIQAIVVNSGNANASTGILGYNNAKEMASTTAKYLGIHPEDIIVASTGVIGVQLPMGKIVPGIEEACKAVSEEGGEDIARAIMTTDTFPKVASAEFELDGKNVIISGIAKGSGMIHPNMATMLGFIATDANISKEMLDKAFKESVEKTYNMVSVDGDTSTNDMAVIIANGVAGNTKIVSEDKNYKIFKEAIDALNTELAKLIAKDGEGATKLIEVNVSNAKTLTDARKCAKAVVSSSLVKAAIFGSDANWGRIVCALGYSETDIDIDKIEIWMKSLEDEIKIAVNGVGVDFDEVLAKKILDTKTIIIDIDLKDGDQNATAWGCDLTYDYVKINGAYRT